MTTDLERELTAGMAERVASVRLGGDVLVAAARRHRRRVVARRAASATGTLTVAGAVLVVAIGGGPAGPAAPPPGAVSPGATSPAVIAELPTVAFVAARVDAAVSNTGDVVQHVVSQVTFDGQTSQSETWFDTVTGAQRIVGADSPSSPRRDQAMAEASPGGNVVTTVVDFASRTWWTETFPPRSAGEGPYVGGGLLGTTPSDVRDSLTGASESWTVVGPAELDGRATICLRRDFKDDAPGTGGSEQIWVDAETYDVLRTQAEKATPGIRMTVRSDFSELARTPDALANLTVVPPAGFTRVPPPVSAPEGVG
ncbi:hypothetical protein [Frankia nepalensis]|uniref:Uncharacterized protein n=1 Tax=Frankia nepalensis TaxID=1836974 RepID=A0A937UUN4_9ACTN|nr:hypothetical protein [Frankia nepalensis]MBL7498869.1 hypothetical protein [Frankia nepalensis]MBL7513701.1 hypothetical protein [Frankia nepalensis]MBL7631351.1 hypothetical protein [Frankia nepalensis]